MGRLAGRLGQNEVSLKKRQNEIRLKKRIGKRETYPQSGQSMMAAS
jgi:hypothetical protein